MYDIEFKYKDVLSRGEWRKQRCHVSSIREFKRIYGLDKGNVEWDIESIKSSEPNSIDYFEIENENMSTYANVSARWKSFKLAKDDLKNHNDAWCNKGTGAIYIKTLILNTDGSVKERREMIEHY